MRKQKKKKTRDRRKIGRKEIGTGNEGRAEMEWGWRSVAMTETQRGVVSYKCLYQT